LNGICGSFKLPTVDFLLLSPLDIHLFNL